MTRLLFAASAAALLVAACNDQGDSDAVNAAQDAASVPVGQASAAMNAQSTEGYVTAAAMGDMYEIEAAKVALERSTNAEVKALATMIRDDHMAASEKMNGLVPQAAPGATLPTALDERHQGMVDNLKGASADMFDGVYLDQQIAAHNEAVALHRGFQDNTDAPTLAAHAREVLPKIEAHLARAQELDSAT